MYSQHNDYDLCTYELHNNVPLDELSWQFVVMGESKPKSGWFL